MDDLIFLNDHKFNVTLNVLIVTKNPSMAYIVGNWTKKPFNYAVFVEHGKEHRLHKDYFSTNDPSWKITRLTFIIMPPYIMPPNERGQFGGTAFDIWAEIGARLDLDMSFSYQKSYDIMFNQVWSSVFNHM